MTRTLRLALIGKGRWGSVIKKTLLTIPGCELAYEVTHDWKTLLEKTDIDGVIIATPPATHTEIALAFIERSIPVFIEKPMTTSFEDAKRIETAMKKSDVPVMVGHIHLYSPAFRVAKELAQTCGPLRLLISEGAGNGPFREDYSALRDWAPHDLSMILNLMGKMPESVEAWGISSTRPGTNLYDTSQMKLNFPNGTVGLIFNSWLMPQKRKRLTIVSKHCSVVYDDTLSEKKVALFEENGTKISSPVYDLGMPLTLELQAFIRTIVEKEKPISGVAEGLNVVRVLDAAERSIAAGGQSQKVS